MSGRLAALRRSWISLTTFAVLVVLVLSYSHSMHRWTSVTSLVLLSVLTAKLLLALLAYRPVMDTPPRRLDVRVVVAAYNEDADTLEAALRSVLRQRYPIAEVVVVDDGSTGSGIAAIERAKQLITVFAGAGIRLAVIDHGSNRGKRHAMATAFRHAPDAEIYVCVDSDTVLAPDAIYEAMRPFIDPQVNAVTGLILAANKSRNVLTRLINLRYGNAFAYERASYSSLGGSMLCACGSLALYRARVVHKYLDDFINQRFLGVPATFGDDRRMTYYGLLEGKAVYQETAFAQTAVPERLAHFVRQQQRWNKSFFRESLTMLKTMPPTRIPWWLTLLEIVMWLAFTIFLAAATVRLFLGDFVIFTYIGYVILFGYARSVRYLDLPAADASLWQRAAAFALAPLYGAMHIVLLVPIRWWALLTIRSGSWGTRVQVEAAAITVRSRRLIDISIADGHRETGHLVPRREVGRPRHGRGSTYRPARAMANF